MNDVISEEVVTSKNTRLSVTLFGSASVGFAVTVVNSRRIAEYVMATSGTSFGPYENESVARAMYVEIVDQTFGKA